MRYFRPFSHNFRTGGGLAPGYPFHRGLNRRQSYPCHPCFKLLVTSGKELYIFRQCTYIVSIAPKKLSNCLKRAETSVVLIVFDCVLCEVRAYKFISINPVTVSYRRST